MEFNENIFVTAIGTDSGKTVVSAVLVEALGYNYWKPVQAGEPTDSNQIRQLVPQAKVLPEGYMLALPMSPHAAARAEGLQIDLKSFQCPQDHKLIIEGAGGVLVPLNDQESIADLISLLDVKVVLVSNLYLGSINHTLLTINELRRRGIDLLGVVFNGEENKESQDIILTHAKAPMLFHLPELDKIDSSVISEFAAEIRLELKKTLEYELEGS